VKFGELSYVVGLVVGDDTEHSELAFELLDGRDLVCESLREESNVW
jgi:hypothetical protein